MNPNELSVCVLGATAYISMFIGLVLLLFGEDSFKGVKTFMITTFSIALVGIFLALLLSA